MKEPLSLIGILLVPLLIAIAWDRGYAGELWAAWSVLSAYGAPVIALACAVWWLVMRRRLTKERQAIAEREAAANEQTEEARHTMAEAERIRQTARSQVQAATVKVARREQEADARIEAAEFRLNRSVETNIGLHRQVKKLRDRLNGQGE